MVGWLRVWGGSGVGSGSGLKTSKGGGVTGVSLLDQDRGGSKKGEGFSAL